MIESDDISSGDGGATCIRLASRDVRRFSRRSFGEVEPLKDQRPRSDCDSSGHDVRCGGGVVGVRLWVGGGENGVRNASTGWPAVSMPSGVRGGAGGGASKCSAGCGSPPGDGEEDDGWVRAVRMRMGAEAARGGRCVEGVGVDVGGNGGLWRSGSG